MSVFYKPVLSVAVGDVVSFKSFGYLQETAAATLPDGSLVLRQSGSVFGFWLQPLCQGEAVTFKINDVVTANGSQLFKIESKEPAVANVWFPLEVLACFQQQPKRVNALEVLKDFQDSIKDIDIVDKNFLYDWRTKEERTLMCALSQMARTVQDAELF